MFICTNCGKEKSDSEKGAVGWLGNIGFLLVLKIPWWPSEVCKDCEKQVRLFGIVFIVISGVVITIYVIWGR
jgi:hypothetical protein